MFVVVVHYFYRDSWLELKKYLAEISGLVDIVFTVPDHLEMEARREIEKDFPSPVIHAFPNGGMDIGPFLRLVPSLQDAGYSHVCKLHTKSLRDPVSKEWFLWLIRVLIGSASVVENVKMALSADSRLKYVGVAGLYLSATVSMYGNRECVERLSRNIFGKLPGDTDWGFFAGTMFWARLDYVRPISAYALNQVEILDIDCAEDGHFVHGLERLFGLVFPEEGSKIGLLHASMSGHCEHVLVESDGREIATRFHINDQIHNFRFLAKDIKDLRKGKVFDDFTYSAIFGRLGGDIDLMTHYCLIGRSLLQNHGFQSVIRDLKVRAEWIDPLHKLLRSWGYPRTAISFLAKYDLNEAMLRHIFNLPGFLKYESSLLLSGWFEEDWYLSQLPLNFQLRIKPIQHYLMYGFRVGFEPCRGFDPLSYLLENNRFIEEAKEPLLQSYLDRDVKNLL